MFSFLVRSFHVYKTVWGNPSLGEELQYYPRARTKFIEIIHKL